MNTLSLPEPDGSLDFDDYQSGFDKLDNLDRNLHTKHRLPILYKMSQLSCDTKDLCNVAYNMANEQFPYQEGINMALDVYTNVSLMSGGISSALSGMLEVSKILDNGNINNIVLNAIKDSTDVDDLWPCIDIAKDFNLEISRQCLIKCFHLCTSEQDFNDTLHDDLKEILSIEDRTEIAKIIGEKLNSPDMVYAALDVKRLSHPSAEDKGDVTTSGYQWKSDEEYWNMKDPMTGYRYDIPYLNQFDPEYRRDYIDYMKDREINPEGFRRILNWD